MLSQVALSDLTENIISSDQVLFAHKNYADKVDILVLENTTGDSLYYDSSLPHEMYAVEGDCRFIAVVIKEGAKA